MCDQQGPRFLAPLCLKCNHRISHVPIHRTIFHKEDTQTTNQIDSQDLLTIQLFNIRRIQSRNRSKCTTDTVPNRSFPNPTSRLPVNPSSYLIDTGLLFPETIPKIGDHAWQCKNLSFQRRQHYWGNRFPHCNFQLKTHNRT